MDKKLCVSDVYRAGRGIYSWFCHLLNRGILIEILLLLSFFMVFSNPAVAEDTYKIKKGDTLWDISDRFLEDPFKWRELWRLNPFITNPDLIFPGEEIKLKEIEKTPPPVVKKEEMEEIKPPETLPTERIAPPKVEEKPIPKVLTVSIPGLRNSGFISSEDIKGSGKIIGSKDKKILLSEGDEVYVKFEDKQGIEIGDRFTIFEVSGEVLHPVTGEKMGYMVDVIGDLRITGSHNDLFLAEIERSNREIQKGARLLPSKPIVEKVEIKKGAPSVKGVVLAGQEGRVSLAQGDIVYIDLGRKDGLDVGNILNIYKKTKPIYDPYTKKETSIPNIQVGKMVIVKAEDNMSTAYIIDATKEIHRGDLVQSISLE